MVQTRSSASAGNLGAEVTPFIGRRHEAFEVKRLLSVTRLATLTGVGGVGKTRLAMRVARDLNRTYPDGAWVVDLAPLDDEGLLTQTVASALGLQDQTSRWSISVIASHLADKELLLILDNCEHLRDGCAVLVDLLLRQVPGLRVLTTSRQTLGLTGEQVFPVPPLSLPSIDSDGGAQSVGHYEAIHLFVERARAVRPGFELSDENVDSVTAICRRLDGVPLAIELAAARLSALSVNELLERLEDRFRLLVSNNAAALPRHQTLKELIGWSWDLCSPEEQALWAGISVFPSHFDLAAAEAICHGGVLEEHTILDRLTALVDKTIVVAQEENGRIRYRMLETLREYGRGRLREAEEETSVRRRHLDYYQHLVQLAEGDWYGSRQRDWLVRLRLEHSNLRVAFDTSFADASSVDAGLEMVTGLWLYWIAAGATSEARSWLDRGLRTTSTPSPVRTRALATCAYLCIMEQDVVSARSLLTEAKAAASDEPDGANAARVCYLTALAALSDGDLDVAEPILQQLLPRQGREAEEADFLVYMDTAFSMGAVRALRKDFDGAEAVLRAAIETCDAHRESWSKSYMLWCLGFVDLQRSDLVRATSHAHEALMLGKDLEDPWAIACSFELLAWIAATLDDAPRAARLLGAARRIWGRTGVSLFGIRALTLQHDARETYVLERLGEQGFQETVREGTALSLDDAIREALGEVPVGRSRHADVPKFLRPLTKREREVALLVAEGSTNKDVAARLVISQRTAEAHLERILSKLGFSSRTQVATWVVSQMRNEAPSG
jgi:predicted ATPase/DNA-binding CsgD family transcriptional regulator